MDVCFDSLRHLRDVRVSSFDGFPFSSNVPHVSGSAIELTWNHWSKLVNPSKESLDGSSKPSPLPDYYELRPVWQRLGLCLAHLGIGIGAGVALITTHIRVIRTFAILSPPTTSTSQGDLRRVFIQGAHNWKQNGSIFPINKCSLDPGRDDTEMILRVKGERGHWFMGLDGAKINGRETSLAKAQTAIWSDWKQKASKGRWKNGPVVGRDS